MSLRIVPVSFRDACGFVAMWHRHHDEPVGHKFCHGVADRDGILRGVAITGRPVARLMDDGLTLEVTRVATDGTRNACSMLYGASARTVTAFGYRLAITYIQDGESGASLRAAGWHLAAELEPRPGWDMPGRPRRGHDRDGIGRQRWERDCYRHAGPWTAPARPEDPPRADAIPPTLWEAS